MSDKYFVIAGNYEQYRHFIKRKAQQMWDAGQTSVSLSNFVFVSGPEMFKGYSNPKGFFVGSWRQRKDLKEIFLHLFQQTENNHHTSYAKLANLYDDWCEEQKNGQP